MWEAFLTLIPKLIESGVIGLLTLFLIAVTFVIMFGGGKLFYTLRKSIDALNTSVNNMVSSLKVIEANMESNKEITGIQHDAMKDILEKLETTINQDRKEHLHEQNATASIVNKDGN